MTIYNSGLDVPFFCDDLGKEVTVKQYLGELLTTLWIEGEGFSGKRPFGNSGWQYDIFAPLIREGFVKGSLDDDGYVEDYDRDQAFEYVESLIVDLFELTAPVEED